MPAISARFASVFASVLASVLLMVEPRSQAAILTRLKAVSEVERVFTTSGRFDLLLQVACPNTQVLDSVLDQIGAGSGNARHRRRCTRGAGGCRRPEFRA